MPSARRIFGDAGEHAAERALVARGWRVVARNARTRYGEIDLVCHDGASLVFVEVKTRRSHSFVQPEEALTFQKRERLKRLALAWLALHGERGATWRLALAAVRVGDRDSVLELIDVVE